MPVESMGLGLPEDIEADEDAIRDSASDLLSTKNTMLGYSTDLEGTFLSAAGEFTDMIAWDITGASAQEIAVWRDVAEHLTHGAGTLTLYADAVADYREARSDIQSRWDEYKSAALGRIDEFGADTLTASGITQEAEEEQYLQNVRSTLLTEHSQAKADLDDATDDTKDALTNGPSSASWKRIEDAGLMTGREIFLFGGRPDPAVDFVPEKDWTSEEVARWWSTLAPNQQEHAMEEYPDDLRNLNGVPVTVRDELNRAKLEQEIERLSGAGMGHMAYSWEQLREIEEILTADDKYLIHFDPYANGGGEAAISTGNPDHADNVSTLVPGMLNDMGTLELPIARSEAIHEQMQGDQPDADHASIVWMGYNAPIGGGFDPQESAERLVEFQDGLRATHEGDQPSHNTVIGHSFGAFVAGAADNPKIGGGLNADAMVLVGGPGASTDNITDLSMAPEDIHIVLGEDDWIHPGEGWMKELRNLGIDEHYGVPLNDEDFFRDPENPDQVLGNRLDPEEDTGHSLYFEDEETLEYLGEVLTGNA